MVKKYFCSDLIYWAIVVNFTLVMWVNIAIGATFYVAKSGSDSNPGTESQPWLTIGKAASTVAAGDTVLIKAGIYQESVICINNGTPSAKITYKAYGDGEVIISGRTRTLPTSSGWTLTSGQTKTYEISEPTTVNGVAQDPDSYYYDIGFLGKKTSVANVEAAPGWYYDPSAQKLYVHFEYPDGDNPNNHVTLFFYDYEGFRMKNDYIVDGIAVQNFAVFGIRGGYTNANRCIVRNCVVKYIYGDNGANPLYTEESSIVSNNIFTFSDYGPSISGYQSTIGSTVTHNTIYRTRNFAASVGNGTNSTTNIVKNNIVYAGGSSSATLRLTGNLFTNPIFDYNLYRKSSFTDGDFEVAWTTGTYYTTLSSFQSATGQEAHGLSNVDPKFVSKTKYSEDFSLQPDSPAIGASDDGLDLGAYIRPTSPTGISGKPTGTSKKPTIIITWNSVVRNSNKITGYNIYRSTDVNIGYSLIGTVAGETTTQWTDTSALIGTSYYYKIMAYKGDPINIESWYSSSMKVTIPPSKTTVPAGQGTEISAFYDPLTKIIIPANTLMKDLIFTIDKVTSLPSTVDTAKVVSGTEFKVEDLKGNVVKELEGLMTIVIHTTSSDGIYVDDTEPKIKKEEVENKLIIGYWSGLVWIPMTNTSRAWTEGNNIYVMAKTNHFSIYGIMVKGTSKISVTGVRVFPNPVTPNSSDSRFNRVTFVFENSDNETVEIEIWDVTGVLVRRLEGMPGITILEWDCRNEYGDIVEGGVYIWQLKVGNSRVGKGTIVVGK